MSQGELVHACVCACVLVYTLVYMLVYMLVNVLDTVLDEISWQGPDMTCEADRGKRVFILMFRCTFTQPGRLSL